VKLTIEKTKLAKPAAMIARLATGKVASSRCVAIDTEQDCVLLRGSDGEIALTWRGQAGLGKVGSAIVNAERFAKVVAACGESIELAAKKTVLEIRSGASRWEIGLETDGPPSMRQARESVNGIPGDLAACIERVIHAADAEGGSRYAIGGVLVERAGGRWRAIATDGRRMSVAGDRGPKADCGWILPMRLAKTLSQVFGASRDGAIGYCDASIAVASGGGEWTVEGRLLEGRFPRWQDVIPSLPHSVQVASHELRDLLARVAVCATDSAIDLEIGEGVIKASSQSETSKAEAEIETGGGEDTQPLKTRVNAAYLAEFIAPSVGDVYLWYGKPSDAIVIDDCDDCVGVVMPMATEG
jgi:DNA polymerase-3 subunit beta